MSDETLVRGDHWSNVRRYAKLPLDPAAANVVVLDDESTTREQLERLYSENGFSVAAYSSADDCLRHLTEEDTDFIIMSIHLAATDPLEFVAQIHQKFPDVPVVAMTGGAEIQTAVDVLKLGACDFVVKPFEPSAVLQSTRAALENSKAGVQARQLRRWLKGHFEFGDILSPTPDMSRVFELICTAAPSDMPVLITGETGTIKEQVAYVIHQHSARRTAPFIGFNCAGCPEALLEGELFGYDKNSFAGAYEGKPGKIAQADGGTLFLDEIENLSLTLQRKLLEVIENRRFCRLGAAHSAHVDVRVIAASNSSVNERVLEGLVLGDLYSRMSAVPIHLPPLRERVIDIPHLIEHFLHYHPVAKSKRIAGVSDKVLAQLLRYSWPGNIRELQNTLECAILLAPGRIIEDVKLPESVDDTAEKNKIASSSLRQWLREKEKYYLSRKLEALGGNIGLTAQSCRIGVRTLSRKMRSYGLDKKVYKEKIPAQQPAISPRNRPVLSAKQNEA